MAPNVDHLKAQNPVTDIWSEKENKSNRDLVTYLVKESF